MTKIMKYLKPYWLSIVLALGLLFGQATCELTMPDYMQNIVNTGIQNGGIESGVYEQVRECNVRNRFRKRFNDIFL